MTNDGPAADPNAPSTSDAWRFDYRLTGWARESHNAAVYCVAFCGKGGTPACEEGGEEEQEEEGGGGDEGELPLGGLADRRRCRGGGGGGGGR